VTVAWRLSLLLVSITLQRPRLQARRKAWRIALCLAVLFTACAHQSNVVGPKAHLAAFKGHGRLAFIWNHDLYVLKGDQSTLRKIASSANAPTWSPDGRWLAYVSLSRSDTNVGTLQIADSAGRVASTGGLRANVRRGDFEWSPTTDVLVVTPIGPTGPRKTCGSCGRVVPPPSASRSSGDWVRLHGATTVPHLPMPSCFCLPALTPKRRPLHRRCRRASQIGSLPDGCGSQRQTAPGPTSCLQPVAAFSNRSRLPTDGACYALPTAGSNSSMPTLGDRSAWSGHSRARARTPAANTDSSPRMVLELVDAQPLSQLRTQTPGLRHERALRDLAGTSC
jgi:hypothetical protein